MISVDDITACQRLATKNWKQTGVQLHETDFMALVEQNHQYNYLLWHAEDKARRDDMGFEFVRDAKRAIDGYNQARNDAMEAMDKALFKMLKPAPHTTCPVHSESPGMMIDRLSILALKHYHMKLQTQRHDVEQSHIEACQEKLNTIDHQRLQLADCLKVFLEEINENSRTFRVYFQLKMYNSPTLNPELFAAETNKG